MGDAAEDGVRDDEGVALTRSLGEAEVAADIAKGEEDD